MKSDIQVASDRRVWATMTSRVVGKTILEMVA